MKSEFGRERMGYSLLVIGCLFLPAAWVISRMSILPIYTRIVPPRRYHYYYLEVNYAPTIGAVVFGLGILLILIGAWMVTRGVGPSEP